MEIASFVKNLADTHRYGIDCVIDTDNLLALALSNMPIECREPMDSCNDITNTSTVTTITCEGGAINITSDIVNTSHEITQTNLFGKGVIINNPELKVNKNFTASIKGVGIISKPYLLKTSGQTTVTDIDGNTYTFVTIDGYDWFTTNLKTTTLNNGIAITQHTTPTNSPYNSDNTTSLFVWSSIAIYDSPYYSWYNNDSANKNIRGALYSPRASMHPNICPEGWRVPTFEELTNMINSNNSRIRSTSYWSTTPNVPTPNGFNLIPNGYKVAYKYYASGVVTDYNAKYFDLNNVASLWTLTNKVVQLDNNGIIPIRFNVNEPTTSSTGASVPQVITNNTTQNGRGIFNTSTPPLFIESYIPTGNCIRCMRKK
jgi:uncharacterized protein (TIGR02145 family)